MADISTMLRYLRKVFWLKKEEEESITFKEVEDNIYFYGHNMWILFFSMLIACIGLNMNSPAVVIGAMLISPLMGPVIGIGFGLAIQDFTMIGRAARHWLLAIIISLMASTLYFLVTPVTNSTSQLFSFSRATIFDALLAFFGGLAGFLGIARKDGNKVLAGVAISTACMPPLCTAGYGLATAQWNFFYGGLYFYIINCLFIGLGSLMLANYMKFTKTERPVKNDFLKRNGSMLAYAISILAVIPCVFIFADMIREDQFKKNAEQFVSEISKNDFAIIGKNYVYAKDSSTVELTFVGSANDHESKESLEAKLKKYVQPAKLILHYTNTQKNINEADLNELIDRINRQDSLIRELGRK